MQNMGEDSGSRQLTKNPDAVLGNYDYDKMKEDPELMDVRS